jgi:DNA uptake protein ComE-like DNA-binding protein
MIMRTVSAVSIAFLLAASAGTASAQVGRGLLDPNVASDSQLLALPGMTPDLLSAVKAGRPYLGPLALDSVLARSLSRDQISTLYRRMFLHVNLNTASSAEIMLIPGAGRRMAREFAEYRPWTGFAQFRREIGKYADSTEVARLAQYVFIPINLNTASDEDILTIPGLGRRMLREFREYRPYDSIERFRREIGKYVSAGEVARLERYVTIN